MMSDSEPAANPTQPIAIDEIDGSINRIAPTQFRIVDLFTAITLFALAFAILAPVIQRISSEHLFISIGAIGIQLTSAVATFVALASRRMQILKFATKVAT